VDGGEEVSNLRPGREWSARQAERKDGSAEFGMVWRNSRGRKIIIGATAKFFREMSAKIKIPYCIICGKVGVDIGKVFGRDVAIGPDCAKALLPRLEALVSAVAPPKKPKVRRLPPEQLKELIAKRVEERGTLSLYDYARRYGQTRSVVREIAKSLAEERGWEIVQEPKKLILRKPATKEASAEAGG